MHHLRAAGERGQLCPRSCRAKEKTMKRIAFLSAAVLFISAACVWAVELVGVHGSNLQYTTTMDITIGDKPYHLVLTGTALRQKFLFNVYTIGSYVLEGAAVHTAEELAAIDKPKQLHLVMERDVGGGDIAEAFMIAIRQNYPTPYFNEEVNRLVEMMREIEFKKGDHIYLTHQPGTGLRCQVIGKGDISLENPDFSRAIWDIYLGKNNIGEGVKKNLISRLR
jgi:hypothetical protein